ncbi:MAG: patatin-like phospholipase family protein, partial [Planctomycetes bacterium]|nr:patatin-like phospholipase family protein [Planctomycetota bacterium]
MQQPQETGFPEVFQNELEAIVTRRHRAGLGQDDSNEISADADTREEAMATDRRCVTKRVGLALSGGGIRSGSFNLGFLQALYERKILRHVDYLSTVSGGGYVGAFFASLATHPKNSLRWNEHAAQEQNGANCDWEYTFASEPAGRQPPLVRRLIQGGMYLRRPLLFFNRYLLGILTINLVAFTGLCAAVVFAAIILRSLDRK